MNTSQNRTRLKLILLLTLLFIPFQNCSPLHSVEGGLGSLNSEGGGTTFTELKDTIFAPKCMACHNAGYSTDFTSHAALMAGASVQPGSPETSALYIRVENHSMPMGGTPLSNAEVLAIYNWIAAGALDGAPLPMMPPSAPSMLVANAVASTQVILGWADNSDNESGFLVERATVASGPFSALTTTSANVTSYNDLSVTASTTYYYRVTAKNSVGSSAPTSLATVSTPAPPVTTPSPPSNLAATANSSSQITLNWNDNSGNETGFKIERSVGGGAFVQVSTTMANVTSYIDTGLVAATAYTYRVRASNAAGDSAYSAVATGTTQAVNMATFSYISANILSQRCTSCHGAVGGSGGVNLTTYNGVRSQVSVNNANGSKLYTEVNSGNMPAGGAKLPAAQITAIRDWINAGALNN